MKNVKLVRFLLTVLCLSGHGVFSNLQAQIESYATLLSQRVQNLENITALIGEGMIFSRSPVAYPYDLTNPVYCDMLCDPVQQVGESCTKNLGNEPGERYHISVFGPRMSVRSPDITRIFDFHLGTDIINKTTTITNGNLPEIKCTCNGEVATIQRITNPADNSGHRITKSCSGDINTTAVANVESTEQGQYVIVRCNETYKGIGANGWGNIYNAYRHLSSINSSIAVGSTVSQGSTIGIMGETGQTDLNHLHFSMLRRTCPDGNYYNVNPMRGVNPAKNPHVVRTLDKSEIEIYFLNISTWRTDGFLVFRFAVPYYQANLEYIRLKSGAVERVFDFEQRSYETDGNQAALDSNTFDSMELFVFPFNRKNSASYFYNSYKDVLPDDHTGKKYPIPSTGVFAKSAYVLDIKTSLGLKRNLEFNGIEIMVFDIWGKGVKAILTPGNF